MDNWQIKWFNKGNRHNRCLEPVKRVIETQNPWLDSLSLPPLDDTTLLVQRAKTVYGTTKEDVELQLQGLGHHDTEPEDAQSEAKKRLADAWKAKKDWLAKRNSTMPRRALTKTQQSLSTIALFLDSFAGVGEIIKGADQTIGGLIYGTVSLLVTFAKQKQQFEEWVEDALAEITLAFPRLEGLQKLEPTDALRERIAEVFEKSLLLCREIIEYFSHNWKRLLKSGVPRDLKMKTADQLRACLLEITREVDFLVVAKLDAVQKQLARIENVGIDNNTRLKRFQAHHNTRDMADLQRSLGLKFPTSGLLPCLDLSKYRRLLEQQFEHQTKKAKRPLQAHWGVLCRNTIFYDWYTQDASAVLVAGGFNWLHDSQVQLSWLSQGSIAVVEQTQGAHNDEVKTTALYYLCQTKPTVPRRNTRQVPTFQIIMSHLIHQLVVQYFYKLEDQLDMIRDAVETDEWQDEDCEGSFRAAAQLLILLLALLDDHTKVTIVIDRLDQCFWSVERTRELNTAIAELWSIVNDQCLDHITVKILLVVSPTNMLDLSPPFKMEKKKGTSYYVDLAWHQQRDENPMDVA